jgi:hypothetical protein
MVSDGNGMDDNGMDDGSGETESWSLEETACIFRARSFVFVSFESTELRRHET